MLSTRWVCLFGLSVGLFPVHRDHSGTEEEGEKILVRTWAEKQLSIYVLQIGFPKISFLPEKTLVIRYICARLYL
jgi:hypothetical protein